jgi:hypothetical protein
MCQGERFGRAHPIVDWIEAVDGEQAKVAAVYFHRSGEYFVETKVACLAAALHDVGAFTVRADDAAAVDLDFSVFAN